MPMTRSVAGSDFVRATSLAAKPKMTAHNNNTEVLLRFQVLCLELVRDEQKHLGSALLVERVLFHPRIQMHPATKAFVLAPTARGILPREEVARNVGGFMLLGFALLDPDLMDKIPNNPCPTRPTKLLSFWEREKSRSVLCLVTFGLCRATKIAGPRILLPLQPPQLQPKIVARLGPTTSAKWKKTSSNIALVRGQPSGGF